MNTPLHQNVASSYGATPNTSEDRTELLKDAVNLTMEAAYGLQRLDEQQINQLLNGLVRTKLLSADDSYRLRDQLMNEDAFARALDNRVEEVLKRKGLVTESTLQEIRNKISNLEAKN